MYKYCYLIKLICKFSPVPYQPYKGKEGNNDILDLAII